MPDFLDELIAEASMLDPSFAQKYEEYKQGYEQTGETPAEPNSAT